MSRPTGSDAGQTPFGAAVDARDWGTVVQTYGKIAGVVVALAVVAMIGLVLVRMLYYASRKVFLIRESAYLPVYIGDRVTVSVFAKRLPVGEVVTLQAVRDPPRGAQRTTALPPVDYTVPNRVAVQAALQEGTPDSPRSAFRDSTPALRRTSSTRSRRRRRRAHTRSCT